jgi:trehalose 6-phosphate synthase/phosphatase
MSNVSIEPRMADAALMLPSVEAGRNELRRNTKVVLLWWLGYWASFFGASLKLLAYERLLQDYPTWQSKVAVERLILPAPANG